SGRTVRWAGATHSSRPLALGALAPLVGEVGTNQARTIPQAAAAVAAAPAGGVALIGIDDAHLLDDVSAAVLHHLVLSHAAPVVLTLRSGAAAPDAVTALWKDSYLPRIDLQPLSEAETTDLLEAVLGGPVEGLSAHRLWELSRGVVLFLRHLVDQERAADRLHAEHGVWRWSGSGPDLSSPLASLIETQMGALPGPVGRVVDLLAIAEPLAVDELMSLVSRRAVEQAETRRLITVETGGRDDLTARLAHPLYGELRMARTGQLQRRRLRGQVAATLAKTPDTGAERTLRRAMLTIDSDLPPEPALFTAAAQIAFLLSDMASCERLAGAALDAGGGGFPARLARSYAHVCLGRVDDAEVELERLEAEAADDAQRAAATSVRAANLFWGLGRLAQAEAVLDRAEAAIGDDSRRVPVTAMRAAFCAGLGRPEQALSHAQSALAHAALPGPMIAVATYGLVGALGSLGQADQIADAAHRGYRGAAAAVDAVSLQQGLCSFQLTGLAAAGYLDEVERIVAEQHARTRWELGPVHLFGLTLLGCGAVARGRLPIAIRMLNEARAGLRGVSALGYDYLGLLALVRAHAMAGHSDLARQRLAELDAAAHPAYGYLDVEAILDRAWVEAAEGATSTAIARAREGAALAAARHQWAYEVVALQTATRFGDPGGAARLRELATFVDGPRAPAADAHAAALAAGDGPGLDAASAACEAMGDLVAAGDAAAQAAVAYQRRGQRGSSLAAAAHARRLADQTGAHTPALVAISNLDSPLTARQREIAQLIGQGLSNQQIADRLVTSVRTVEGHIYRACGVLGISSRDELAATVRGS
ncbi:helix-turn-helix transcriptional regulator, partial [Mycobacterium talmoniae]|uniref:helix-turn-helix transcriptional regulator n=1 Tax=Mycobacterium talmoniae TaxID=1858794 RepID=UPI000AED9695